MGQVQIDFKILRRIVDKLEKEIGHTNFTISFENHPSLLTYIITMDFDEELFTKLLKATYK